MPTICPTNDVLFVVYKVKLNKQKTLQTIDLQGFDVWVRGFEPPAS